MQINEGRKQSIKYKKLFLAGYSHETFLTHANSTLHVDQSKD